MACSIHNNSIANSSRFFNNSSFVGIITTKYIININKKD